MRRGKSQKTVPKNLQANEPQKVEDEVRPNLYNVVTAFKAGNPGISRIVYLIKLSEDMIVDAQTEKELNIFFKSAIEQEETEITGLLLILGGYAVHIMESESESAILGVLLKVEEVSRLENSVYDKINVISWSQQNPSKYYHQWDSVKLSVSNTGELIDNAHLIVFEKSYALLDNMCKIGAIVTHQRNEGIHSIGQILKGSEVATFIPVLDDILILMTEYPISLTDFLAVNIAMPDLVLENDLIWPIEPELHYMS